MPIRARPGALAGGRTDSYRFALLIDSSLSEGMPSLMRAASAKSLSAGEDRSHSHCASASLMTGLSVVTPAMLNMVRV